MVKPRAMWVQPWSFVNTTTNRLLSSTEANIYAINNSSIPAPGTTPVTTRRLWENKLSVSPTFTLGEGTYWIEFATTTFANANHFYRNVISLNNRTQAGWNARQFTVSTNAWTNILDNGNPASAPDVPQTSLSKSTARLLQPTTLQNLWIMTATAKQILVLLVGGPALSSPTEWFILRNNGSGVDYNYAGVRSSRRNKPDI